MDNADFSQRHAQSDAEEYMEQVERIVCSLERQSLFNYSTQFSDLEKRREFVERLAAELSEKKELPEAGRQEPEEEPMLNREVDDKKSCNSDEPQKYTRRKL